MKLKKILRYAVIGARAESERYADMSVMHEGIDSVKSRYYGKIASKSYDDANEIAKIFGRHAESEIDIL